jgi:large repetitive protein
VSLQQLSAPSAGISLDLSDGSVDVQPGTLMGSYSLTYQICLLADPALCDDAVATVTVPSFAIVARPDSATAAYGVGGTPVADVLVNDTLGGVRATLDLVTLAQVSSTSAGITLNALGGVNVAPGTPNGTHSLVYRICEKGNSTNCAQATVTLIPSVIDAVDDYYRMSSKVAFNTPSVLTNDYFGGARANAGQVRITLLGPLPYGVSFNSFTGVFSSAGKVTSGLYATRYQICELGNLGNCDAANVTLDLSGKNN